MTAKSTSSSFVLVTIGNVAVASAQWYLVWLFARQSGPSAVGDYSALIALMTPVFISAQLGLRNLYITLRKKVRWSTYLFVRSCGVAFSVAVVIGLLGLLGHSSTPSLFLAILFIKISDSFADLFCARLQQAERLPEIGIVQLLNAILTAGVTTIIMLNTTSVVSAVWGAAVVAAIASASTAVLAGTTGKDEGILSDDPKKSTAPQTRGIELRGSFTRLVSDARTLAIAGTPLSLMQGIYSLLSYVPLGIVAWFGTVQDVGRFTGAAYLVVAANLVGASVEAVVLPAYRRTFEARGAGALLHQALRRSTVIALALMPLLLLAVLIGPLLLGRVYGPEFAISRLAVLLLSVAAVVTIPTYLMSANLLVLNRYWTTSFVGVSAVIVVLASGSIAGLAGLGAVESGCFGLMCGSVARFIGEYSLSRIRRLPVAASSEETTLEIDDSRAH